MDASRIIRICPGIARVGKGTNGIFRQAGSPSPISNGNSRPRVSPSPIPNGNSRPRVSPPPVSNGNSRSPVSEPSETNKSPHRRAGFPPFPNPGPPRPDAPTRRPARDSADSLKCDGEAFVHGERKPQTPFAVTDSKVGTFSSVTARTAAPPRAPLRWDPAPSPHKSAPPH